MKPSVIKLWTGIGAYSLTQGLVWAVPAPEAFSQGMGGQNPACQPVVVSEGGEGGEGGEGAARPRYKPAPANQRLRDPKVLAGIVEGFVNHVVIPNYQALEQSAADLNEAVQALVKDPKPETLAAAREAFRRSRVIWEESEAFAFGPAATLGLDGALDEWPLDEREVVAVLPGSSSLTPEKAAELPDGLRGYHAVGFLLFGSRNNKSLADFTPQDYAYLKVVTPVLAKTAQTLRQTWTDGVDAFPAYGKVMTTAGNQNAVYPAVGAAVQEIVQGMIDLADELGNIKIGEAVDAQNPFLLEGRFADHSLEEFAANLDSIANIYMGRYGSQKPAQISLSSVLSQRQPRLHQKIMDGLARSRTALAQIPAPIEQSLCQAQDPIRAAQREILALLAVLSDELMPLVVPE